MNNISFFSYKSINISYFMAFAIISGVLAYILSSLLAKEYKMDKSKIQDMYLTLLIIGFIGARLGYVFWNFKPFKGKLLSILSLSHYNLSLLGGVVGAILALIILARMYKINFNNLLSLFATSFYFAMAIGVWVLKFDYLLFMSSSIGKSENNILLVSAMFLLAMVLETYLKNRVKNKYITPTILIVVMALYYLI